MRNGGTRVTLLFGALVVITAVVLAVAGLEVVERLVPWSDRQNHNDVAGFIYAVLGVVYAVLLAFVTIAVWEDFETSKHHVNLEASELAELYWLGENLPESEGREIQRHAVSYARVVVQEEWPAMVRGESSPKAWELVDEIRSDIGAERPNSDTELIIYDKVYDAIKNLEQERRIRLFQSTERIPLLLWWILIVGGLLVVGFTYLFGLENTRSHRLMIASLAAIIALVIFTVRALDQPFTGITRVPSTAFEQVLDRLEQVERDR